MRQLTLASILGLSLAVAPSALAQDMPGPEGQGDPANPAPEAPTREDRRNDRREREVQRAIQQMVERLGLDEAQAARVQEVIQANLTELEQVRKDAEARTSELEKQRDAKIAELLTPEQTTEFEAIQADRAERRQRFQQAREERGNRARGGRGGEGGGRGGMMGRILGADPEALAEQLGLSDEQRTQIQESIREVMGNAREMMQAARGEGREGMMRVFGELRAQVQERVNGLLTEEQQAKFAEVVAQAGEQGRGGRGGERGERGERGRDGRGGARGRNAGTPEERAQRRMEAVLRDLALSEDEQLILEPKMREILTLDADAGAAAQTERQALEELVKAEGEVDGEAMRARMDALRQAREANGTQREALEAELRELVTIQQEAVLFLHRVLR